MYTNKIFILDFYDSFTYNIASDLSLYFSNIEVLKYDLFLKDRPDLLIQEGLKFGIILGPGPGHPTEYREIFKLLADISKKPNLYIYGICLGHQLIASYLGMQIIPAKCIKHGESEKINFRGKEFIVQRYNSLAVKGDLNCQGNAEYDGEIIILEDNNLFSVQFHPESVGTNDGHYFYRPLLDFFKTR